MNALLETVSEATRSTAVRGLLALLAIGAAPVYALSLLAASL